MSNTIPIHFNTTYDNATKRIEIMFVVDRRAKISAFMFSTYSQITRKLIIGQLASTFQVMLGQAPPDDAWTRALEIRPEHLV